MAESDSYSSLTDIENDSVLTGLVYSSSEVTEDDALLVTSLSLPVGITRPYFFWCIRQIIYMFADAC